MSAPLTIGLRKTKRAEGHAVFYDKLVAHVGDDVAAKDRNTPIPIETVLDVCGLWQALWALGAIRQDRLLRLFVCDCAERLLPTFEAAFPKDARPRMAIQAGRDFADGRITEKELLVYGTAAQRATGWNRPGGVAKWNLFGEPASAAETAAWTACGAAERPPSKFEAWRHPWSAAQIALQTVEWAEYGASLSAPSPNPFAPSSANDSKKAERAWQIARLREYLRGEVIWVG